ncbi:TetR/AcrR family transcriptional regulator [Elizabethkingia anophelis]
MQLFFGERHFKATTQEIADAAGVNRTSINYYFRSRDNLFKVVFEEAIEQMHQNHNAILLSELPFRDKLSRWLDDELASALKYPFLEIYIVTQLSSDKCAHMKDEEHVESITKVLEERAQNRNRKRKYKTYIDYSVHAEYCFSGIIPYLYETSPTRIF